MVGVPGATAPVSKEEIAPRSLVAEGSNYVRPLRNGLRWWGFVQAQFQTNQDSEDQLNAEGEPLNQDQFGVRRARLRIDHGWENAFATLELDAGTLNGPNIRLRRAEASLLYRGGAPDDVVPLFVLTGGVTDIPFGAEIGESQRDRLFMERSIASTALFANEADLGVKLWGGYKFLNYAVAVINGEPLGQDGFPRDPNAHKDIVGHVGASALLRDNLRLDGGLSFYTGQGFAPGSTATKDSLTWVDDNANGVAESYEILGVTGSSALPSQNFSRWALGLDLGTSVVTPIGLSRVQGEVVIATNLDRTILPSNPVLTGSDARQTGLSLSLTQQITDYGVVGFRAAFYDPNSDLFEQRAGVTHLRNQTYWVLTPVVGVTLSHGRLIAQYDFVQDQLGRDDQGVPTDVRNDQFTLRLQVDL